MKRPSRSIVASGIVAAALVAIFTGCPLTPKSDPDPDPGGETGGFQQQNDLFVEQGQPGTYVFQTNDPAYWGPYGYTLWALKGAPQQPFVGREVSLNKASGDAAAGYGVVFCHEDSGETMLAVMINTKQEFIVGEVNGAQFTEIVPWTGSSCLRPGYDQNNVIGIEYDGAQRAYTLSINGSEVRTFRDEEAPFHDNGGAGGFIVVVSPLDRFPQAPVHVIFEEQ